MSNKQPEPAISCNIHLTSGSVFKLPLTEVPAITGGTPQEIGPTLPLAGDEPGRNTLAAIDWGQVAAITYRVAGEPGRPPSVTARDVVEALRNNGGQVTSKRELATLLAASHGAVDRALAPLYATGAVEPFDGPRRAVGYRLTGTGLPEEPTTAMALSSR